MVSIRQQKFYRMITSRVRILLLNKFSQNKIYFYSVQETLIADLANSVHESLIADTANSVQESLITDPANCVRETLIADFTISLYGTQIADLTISLHGKLFAESANSGSLKRASELLKVRCFE